MIMILLEMMTISLHCLLLVLPFTLILSMTRQHSSSTMMNYYSCKNSRNILLVTIMMGIVLLLLYTASKSCTKVAK